MLTPEEVLESYPQHDGTLYGLFQSRAIVKGEEPFLISSGGTTSWRDFHALVNRLAAVLVGQGVTKGARVAIASASCPLYVASVLALARLGAICVPLNHELGAAELAYIVGHAGVSGAVASAEKLSVVREACRLAHVSPWYAVFDETGADAPALSTLPCTPFDATQVGGHAADTWVILYTSGTTGFPKGVMHSQRSFTLVAESFVDRMCLQPDDRLLCVLPLFHVNALFNSVGGAIAAGASLVLEPRFSASRFWRVAADTRATEVNTIAAIGYILARRPVNEFRGDHRISKVYGAPISPEIAQVFHERFHIDTLVEGYGLTEATGVCTNTVDEARLGTMGRPASHPFVRPYAEIRVVDDSGRDLPDGQAGEVLARTPAIMQGYYRDPRQTREAFIGGWFRTGDIAWRDEEGYYHFVQRAKDIIRRRGENISAAEIERVIRTHPAVQDAAVIGVDAELGEEEIFAIVLPLGGATVTESDIAQWCGARLAAYKVPRFVAFVATFPYTPSHRVAKHKLRGDRALRGLAVDIFSQSDGKGARLSA